VPGSVLQASDAVGEKVQLVIGPGFEQVVPVQVTAPPAAPETVAAPETSAALQPSEAAPAGC
jgi:hypothetical protein